MAETLKDNILTKIKAGQIKMKPKIYFLAKVILIILAVIGLILLGLYFISFLIFSLRLRGTLYLPHFGWWGIKRFLLSLPWILILIILGILIGLELFAKNVAALYRKPLLYSLLILIALLIIGGLLLERTSFHPSLIRRKIMPQRMLPPPPSNVWRGIISKIEDDQVILKNLLGQEYEIQISSSTLIVPFEELKEGDSVLIIGRRNGSTIAACRIQKLEDRVHLEEQKLILPYRKPIGF